MPMHIHPIVSRGRSSCAILALWLAAAAVVARGADDPPQAPIEVYEWSVWVGNPAQAAVNAARVYKNAMPGPAGTTRPKLEEKEAAGKFPVAPISVVQFFGEPRRDIDVDLRLKKGTFAAHWPQTADRGNRLQWFKSDLSAAHPDGVPQSYLPEAHWFQKLRAAEPALFVKNEARVERFLAYDAELAIPVPLKVRGGPDEYTLQNQTDRRLLDVALIVPTEKGYRVGWLDELPTAAPAEKPEQAKKKAAEAAKGRTDAQKADAVFRESEAKPGGDALPPLPAEADATVRAQVDQILNRPVTVAVEQAPGKDVLALIAGQARLRYELDDKAIAKAEINLARPTTLKANGLAARDALAEVLGNLGLSYRVVEDGTLFITTGARLAEEADKKGSVVEGPPVKLTLSQPLKAADPSYRELTRDAHLRRLTGQGLREDVARQFLDQYAPALFEPGELIVLAHLSREAIDEAVLLDVFPPPKKLVRTAVMVIHGVDPRLQDRARSFVQQLGDKSPKTRDTAESRLFEMGPVAVPALEDALTSKDLEIVFRAERLLLRLNRQVP